MRQKKLISYAKLNDKHGDESKDWYVEYSFRLPGSDQLYKYRKFNGLCVGVPSDERYTNAQKMIDRINKWLKTGQYLKDGTNYDPVLPTESYRGETQRYQASLSELQARSITTKYIDSILPTLRIASVRKYRGEFNIFCDYIEQRLNNTILRHVTTEQLQGFFDYLASDSGRGLCKESIKQYKLRLTGLFDYMKRNGMYDGENPATHLQNKGKMVDCAPSLYTGDERLRLKNAILPKQPYLWLAIELMYYSMIRPGECRQIRIGDIDRHRRTITIRNSVSKNKRTSTVGISEDTFALMERLGVFAYSCDLYLFGRGGIPGEQMLGKATMRKRYYDYRKQLGIDDSKTLYAWKHTGITEMLDAGAPLPMVMDQARHADITTTMRYAKKRGINPHAFENYVPKI